MEARSLKSKCHTSFVPSGTLGRILLLSSSIASNPWHSMAPSCITAISASMTWPSPWVCVSSSYKDTSCIGSGAHSSVTSSPLNNCNFNKPIFTQIYVKKYWELNLQYIFLWIQFNLSQYLSHGLLQWLRSKATLLHNTCPPQIHISIF